MKSLSFRSGARWLPAMVVIGSTLGGCQATKYNAAREDLRSGALATRPAIETRLGAPVETKANESLYQWREPMGAELAIDKIAGPFRGPLTSIEQHEQPQLREVLLMLPAAAFYGVGVVGTSPIWIPASFADKQHWMSVRYDADRAVAWAGSGVGDNKPNEIKGSGGGQ
jgi:hypothetical protein